METARHIFELLGYKPDEPMLFSSGLFWALFLVFLPVYSLLRKRKTQMIVFVVAFSLYFYYKSSGLFVGLLIATSLVDWVVSRLMVEVRTRGARLRLMAVSLTLSLGILAYFKYANFFLWNINALVEGNFQPLDLILPVGISFYTFQSVSYIIDVYRGRVAPTRTWLEYAFFLSFFPALVAGPIVRADYFLPQIAKEHHATRREVWFGLWLILTGVVKKAIVADYIAQYNDLIFDAPGTYSGFETLMGIIGYTMQIYCDFSGYSDMAIGISLIMGFRLARNFNFPYKATNLTDFWRRWHISLSTWLRDYIYIPLGGNRKGTARTYLNNFATMVIGGLWHGAAWRFVFWGAMHGAGLAVHKATKPWMERRGDSRLIRWGGWLVTMLFVMVMWVFFRASSWTDAGILLSHAVADFDLSYAVPFASARVIWLVLMLFIIVSHFLGPRFWSRMAMRFVMSRWWMKLIVFLVVIQLTVELRSESVTPFIYFQF